MKSSELQLEIYTIEAQIKPLATRLESLRRQHRDALSIEWIKANNVTRSDVLNCEDAPHYFGHVKQFCEYLRDTNPPQRWAAWNGVIHSVSELKDGKFIQTSGRIDDLPQEKANG